LVMGATAYALTAIFVNTTKYTVRHHRPDTSTHNSFPSGHTATVFTGVEILYQEYKHYDPWIGIGGYAVAAGGVIGSPSVGDVCVGHVGFRCRSVRGHK